MKRISSKPDDLFWMRFCPADWRTDNGLACCSLEARGLWIEILCCMWTASVRGVLAGSDIEIARMTRAGVEDVARALPELERNGVLSRGRDVDDAIPPDAIVSRRMYRDSRVSAVRSEAGRAGGRASKTQANAKQNASKTQANIEANGKQNNLHNLHGGKDLQCNGASKTQANAKQNESTRARAFLELELKSETDKEIKTPLPPGGGSTLTPADSLSCVEAQDPKPTRFAAEVRDAWNETARAAGLPQCRDLTRDRQRKIGARSREHFWADNWRAALAALPRDDFRCGREPGKSWKADIDYFLRPDSVAKILEKAGAEKPKLTYGTTLADLADIPDNSFRRRPKEEPKP